MEFTKSEIREIINAYERETGIEAEWDLRDNPDGLPHDVLVWFCDRESN